MGTVSPFPNGFDTFPDWEDGVDEVAADNTNWPDDAIEKLERFVGVRPGWWTWMTIVEAITWLYYQIVGGGAPAPPTPSGLTYQPELSGMTVLVDFSVDRAHLAPGFDYFKVYMADDQAGTNAAEIGWFRGTTFNTARWIVGWSDRYWAVSAVALGGAESGLSAWTRPSWPTASPTPAVVSTSSGYDLTWTPITETREYKIYRAEDGSGTNAELANTVPGASSMFLDTFVAGKPYYCLQAVLYDGTALPASPWVTGSAPAAPINCLAVALAGNGDTPTYHLSWAHSYPDTVKQYGVLQWNGVDGWNTIWTGDGTLCDIPGGYNLFEVRAIGWEGLYTDSVSFSDATPPATPYISHFTIAGREDGFTITVNLSLEYAYHSPGFRRWEVEVATDETGSGAQYFYMSPTELPKLTGELGGGIRCFRFRGYDWAGNASGWSDWATIAGGDSIWEDWKTQGNDAGETPPGASSLIQYLALARCEPDESWMVDPGTGTYVGATYGDQVSGLSSYAVEGSHSVYLPGGAGVSLKLTWSAQKDLTTNGRFTDTDYILFWSNAGGTITLQFSSDATHATGVWIMGLSVTAGWNKVLRSAFTRDSGCDWDSVRGIYVGQEAALHPVYLDCFHTVKADSTGSWYDYFGGAWTLKAPSYDDGLLHFRIYRSEDNGIKPASLAFPQELYNNPAFALYNRRKMVRAESKAITGSVMFQFTGYTARPQAGLAYVDLDTGNGYLATLDYGSTMGVHLYRMTAWGVSTLVELAGTPLTLDRDTRYWMCLEFAADGVIKVYVTGSSGVRQAQYLRISYADTVYAQYTLGNVGYVSTYESSGDGLGNVRFGPIGAGSSLHAHMADWAANLLEDATIATPVSIRTPEGTLVTTIDDDGLDAAKLQGQPVAATTPTEGQALVYDGSQWGPGSVSSGFPCDGRLTLTSGTPITTSNVTAATTVYFSPFRGSHVALYDGSAWTVVAFSEKSIKLTDATQTGTTTSGSAVVTGLTDASQLIVGMKASGAGIPSGATIASVDGATQVTLSASATASGTATITFSVAASTNLDIFGFLSSGELKLEMAAWSSDTARATALTTQDDIYVKSGDATRRYLGTIRTTTTDGQCEDSETARFVWNYYNRARRKIKKAVSTSSWTYATASWRAWNNTSSNRMDVVVGVEEDPVVLLVLLRPSAAYTYKIGVGDNSTSASSCDVLAYGSGSNTAPCMCHYIKYVIGYHALYLLEYGSSSTSTLIGASESGGVGWLMG